MNDHTTISTFQLFKMFPDNEAARVYLEARLWPSGPRCPVCAGLDSITTRANGYYRCNKCAEDFTVRTGTVMERSHVPLHAWLVALGIIAGQPEIPSAELGKALGVTQKTAWLILRRVHEAAGAYLSESFAVDDENHRIVADWPAYRVGRNGSIWTRYRTGRGGRLGLKWRAMNPSPDKDGYRVVRLYRDGGQWKQLRVPVLVCTAFHGPAPKGHEVRHLDGKLTNDAAGNLAWGTSAQNKADMRRHGTAPLGETHHNATLTDAQVADIRALKGKMLQRQIAAKFGITQGYVSELQAATAKRRITYKELTA